MSGRARAVVVIGMHRSGTSLVAQAVRSLGVYWGEENRMVAAREDNPEGFWEHAEIVSTHDELLSLLSSSWDTTRPLPETWWSSEEVQASRKKIIEIIDRDFAAASLWGFKDPRMSLMIPLWTSIFEELKIDVRYVITLRNPLSVAASLHRRDRFSRDKSFAIWNLYMLSCLRHTDSAKRIVIDYDAFIEDPEEQSRRISAFLDLPYTALHRSNIVGLSKPSLRHSDRSVQDAWDDPSIPTLVRETYRAALQIEAEILPSEADSSNIRIRQAYERLIQNDRLLMHEKSYRVRVYWAGREGAFAEERSTYLSVNATGRREVHVLELREPPGPELRIDFVTGPAYVRIFEMVWTDQGRETDLLRQHARIHTDFIPLKAPRETEGMLSGLVTGSHSQLLIQGLPPQEGEVSLRLTFSFSPKIEAGMIEELKLQQAESVLAVAIREAGLRVDRLQAANAEQAELLAQAAQQIEQQIETLELLSEENREQQRQLAELTLRLQQEQQAKNESELLARQKDSQAEQYRREIALYAGSLSWKVTAPLRATRELERRARRTLKRWAKRMLQGYTIRRNRRSRRSGLSERMKDRQYVLVFSHTSYLKSMGGTEKYIHEQAVHLKQQQIGMIQIYPGQSYSLLNTRTDTYYGVIVDDQFRGFYSVEEIGEWLSSHAARVKEVYTHHLLNWQIVDYLKLLQRAEARTAPPHFFFMHDFFALCSSYHMIYEPDLNQTVQVVREPSSCIAEISAAPGRIAPICESCTHGATLEEWRRAIRPVLERADQIVAPSRFAGDTAITVYPEFAEKVRVREHLVFDQKQVVHKPKPEHRKLRLAYLGYKMNNKGWLTWERLYKNEALGRIYEFHHIGSQERYAQQVAVHSYSFLKEGTMGATDLMIAQDIDLVLLWSIVPESYSYTLQEAIAAGIPVLTSPKSGNIAATLDAHPELGKVLAGESELHQFLLDAESVRSYVSGDRARYTLAYHDLFAAEREVRS